MELILALFMQNLAKDAVPAKDLAAEVMWLSAAYEVNPETVARIIIVESRGREKAMNRSTNDYGLMQLNEVTMKRMGISMKCAMHWKCNLKMGIRILSGTNRVCQYNVGTGSLIDARLKRCLHYEKKLANL